ncbi:MAG: nucleotide exchange factor GrpE [Bacteroidota bacterium]|jgi:molecular chaperone GrpE
MSKKNTKAKNEEELHADHQVEQSIEERDQAQTESEETVQESMSPDEVLAQEKDKFLRLFAEFENYKKRTTKERMDLFKTAGREVISALLPVVDDFERALNELQKQEQTEHAEGIKLIYNKLIETLKSKGLTVIEIAIGDAFDSELHEAITQIKAPEESLVGKVIDVIEKGYKLGDQIIRHPKVVVGN